MPRKLLSACLFAGSSLAIAAAAMVKVTSTDPASVPVAYSHASGVSPQNPDAFSVSDDQKVVGLKSDRLALLSPNPAAAAPDLVSAPSVVPSAQTQLLDAQAMASPVEIEQETAGQRRHHVRTGNAARHKVRSHTLTQPETAKIETTNKDKTAEVACANGNGFLRALNSAPACN